jgi:hypothetical protein
MLQWLDYQKMAIQVLLRLLMLRTLRTPPTLRTSPTLRDAASLASSPPCVFACYPASSQKNGLFEQH